MELYSSIGDKSGSDTLSPLCSRLPGFCLRVAYSRPAPSLKQLTGKVKPALPAKTNLKYANQKDSGTDTGESAIRNQQCEYCLKWFRHVKKHVRYCKKTPTQSSVVKVITRGSGDDGNKSIEDKAEKESSQVPDHSAIKTTSTSFKLL